MRKLFELFDDMTIGGRWHLGQVRTQDGREPLLDAGKPFGVRVTESITRGGIDTSEPRLTVPVVYPGRVLDFSLTSFGVPIASTAVVEAVTAIAGADVQCIPVVIAGQSGMNVMNSTRVIRCLEESRSEFIKWTTRDHRADLAGQYRQVTKLAIDPRVVPADAHFFRVEGWLVALIVSAEVKEAMERIGCVGAKFIDVTAPGP